MVFYDRHGRPTAYSEDGIHVFLFTGEAVAYFDRDAVYSFRGKQLGWFEDGWMRDLRGACVFFTEHATGSGPVQPVQYICPVKSVEHVMPVKSVQEVQQVRAVDQLNWSRLSGAEFFEQ